MRCELWLRPALAVVGETCGPLLAVLPVLSQIHLLFAVLRAAVRYTSRSVSHIVTIDYYTRIIKYL